MKRLLLLITLFSIPFVVFIVYVFRIELPRKYAYRYTRNEGCNIEWIYRRIYENDQNIDLAFLGTSHTGCGINDRLLDSLLPGLHTANLAYCQGGRSIQFAVLKDLLKRHHPKTVVVEVGMDEDPASHRDFGLVGNMEDVISAPVIGNSRYVTDLFKAFQVRYMYFQDRLLNILPVGQSPEHIPAHSFMDVFRDTARTPALEEHRLREMKKVQDHSASAYYSYRMKYPLGYIDKMKRLAAEHNCRLVFIYLPSFGWASPVPFQNGFYRREAILLMPEQHLFTDHDLWFDSEHLNNAGARQLTTWLAKELTETNE